LNREDRQQIMLL